MNKKKVFSGIIGILISAVILWFLLKNIEWRYVQAELHRIQFVYLLLILPVLFVCFILRALRWRYLLPNGKALSLKRLLDATVVGFFASFVLPLRAGEFIRPLALSRWQPVSFSAAFASVVTERVFDVLAMLFLMALCLSRIDEVPPMVTAGGQVLGLIAGVILAIMLFAYLKSALVISLVRKISAKILPKKFAHLEEKIVGMASEFIDGLRAISSFTELALVLTSSLALWVGMGFLYQIGLWAFGEHPVLWVGMTINVMIALAVAAPSAPGFIGTFQLGCVAALSGMYGYSKEFSVAYSVVLHVVQVAVIVLAGAWILKREGMGLGEMQGSSTAEVGD